MPNLSPSAPEQTTLGSADNDCPVLCQGFKAEAPRPVRTWMVGRTACQKNYSNRTALLSALNAHGALWNKLSEIRYLTLINYAPITDDLWSHRRYSHNHTFKKKSCFPL